MKSVIRPSLYPKPPRLDINLFNVYNTPAGVDAGAGVDEGAGIFPTYYVSLVYPDNPGVNDEVLV